MAVPRLHKFPSIPRFALSVLATKVRRLLCVNSAVAQAGDFDVLRQHDQRHQLSARCCLSVNFHHYCTNLCSTPECAEKHRRRSTEIGEKTRASPLRTSSRRGHASRIPLRLLRIFVFQVMTAATITKACVNQSDVLSIARSCLCLHKL